MSTANTTPHVTHSPAHGLHTRPSRLWLPALGLHGARRAPGRNNGGRQADAADRRHLAELAAGLARRKYVALVRGGELGAEAV